MGMSAKSRGDRGELIAGQFLSAKGFTVVQYNYRTPYGEIDVIARSEDYLVFAEVKLRKDSRFARAAESVTAKKQNKLRISAGLYLQQNSTELQPRFDVVEIYAPDRPGEHVRVEHIENAF